MSQVCKRTQVLVCTTCAVQKATQRVRKAFKKRIPIVNVEWLERCRLEKKKLDYAAYSLDDEAKKAIDNRQETLENDKSTEEVDPNAGWTEAVTLGCCCVCHENGTEKECQWCTDCT